MNILHAECSTDAYKLMNILHGESSSVKILCNPTDAIASKKLMYQCCGRAKWVDEWYVATTVNIGLAPAVLT